MSVCRNGSQFSSGKTRDRKREEAEGRREEKRASKTEPEDCANTDDALAERALKRPRETGPSCSV